MRWIALVLASVLVPTVVTTTSSVSVLTEAHYGWYANVDALGPGAALAALDAAPQAPAAGGQLRLRMNIGNSGALALSSGALFTLQYANTTSGPWTDVATATAWAFLDNPSVADGQIIVTTLLTSSTLGESYGESNPTAVSPSTLNPGDYGEWDWALTNNSASTASDWFFRMIYASGTALDAYSTYPKLTAVPPPSGGTTNPPVFTGGGGSPYSIPAPSSTQAPTQPPTQTSTQSSTLPISPPLLPARFQVVDFNGDNHVDIVDLSILLYHYNQSGAQALRWDLNHSGAVGLADISILMYYWTG